MKHKIGLIVILIIGLVVSFVTKEIAFGVAADILLLLSI